MHRHRAVGRNAPRRSSPAPRTVRRLAFAAAWLPLGAAAHEGHAHASDPPAPAPANVGDAPVLEIADLIELRAASPVAAATVSIPLPPVARRASDPQGDPIGWTLVDGTLEADPPEGFEAARVESAGDDDGLTLTLSAGYAGRVFASLAVRERGTASRRRSGRAADLTVVIGDGAPPGERDADAGPSPPGPPEDPFVSADPFGGVLVEWSYPVVGENVIAFVVATEADGEATVYDTALLDTDPRPGADGRLVYSISALDEAGNVGPAVTVDASELLDPASGARGAE